MIPLIRKMIELDINDQVLFSFYRISVNFLTIYDKMEYREKLIYYFKFRLQLGGTHVNRTFGRIK